MSKGSITSEVIADYTQTGTLTSIGSVGLLHALPAAFDLERELTDGDVSKIVNIMFNIASTATGAINFYTVVQSIPGHCFRDLPLIDDNDSINQGKCFSTWCITGAGAYRRMAFGKISQRRLAVGYGNGTTLYVRGIHVRIF